MRKNAQLLSLCLVMIGTGCATTALRDAVNATFPPVNHADHQVTAVKVSAAELAAFTEAPIVYASLAIDDLRQMLPSAVAAHVKASSDRQIDVSAANIRLDLGPQEVIFNLGFDLRLPAEKTSVSGIAEVHCTASVERGSLVLRPSASTIRLSSLTYSGKQSASVITPIINTLLKSFLDNVNASIKAQRIPLRFHATKSIDLAQTLRQTPGVTSSTGTAVNVGVAIGSSAILIDPRAIRVLGSAVFLTTERFVAAFQVLETRVKTKHTDPLTSQELAALAACVDPQELAQTINADPSTVNSVCEEAEVGLRSITSEHFPTTGAAYDALATSYPKYVEGFMQRAQGVEPGNRVFTNSTIVALSRSAVANGIQAVLAGANASATYSQSIPPKTFNDTITPPTTDLKCAANAGSCESVFTYPPFDDSMHCPSDCV